MIRLLHTLSAVILTMMLGAATVSAEAMLGAPKVGAASVNEARAALNSGDLRGALRIAREVVETNPSSGEGWHVLGDGLAARGQHADAVDAYRRALDAVAEDPLAIGHAMATAERRLGLRPLADRHDAQVLGRYRAGEARSTRDLLAAAGAARALARTEPALHHTALRIYEEVIGRDPQDFEARTALGLLLLEKYNNAEALDVFREALERDPEHAAALLGLARSQHFDHSPAAIETVSRALEVNPRLVDARVFLARLLLEQDQHAGSAAEARRALADDPRSVGALTVLAAVRYMEGNAGAFDSLMERIAELAPHDATPWITLAEVAAQNRRYQEAARFAAQALGLDATAWRGHALLGLNLLRGGEIDAGRAALERAFRGDPFDVWTKNTLTLVDTFGEYETLRSGPFELVLHRDEARALAPWLAPLAEEAFEHFAARYGERPIPPVRIEVYPRHEDLSVRTVGLVGVDILGVSFGPVLAMDSPSSRRVGEFNWGSTLWHELAHTFHLELSAHRASRWLSEGLAVHEERRARPGWGADPTMDFLLALREGRLPRLPELNLAFVRPAYPEQIAHAYYLASVVVELIERDHGAEALVAMLRAHRDDLDTAKVVRKVLGTDLEQLDALVYETLHERFASALAALAEPAPDADPLTTYAGALHAGRERLEAEDLDGAEAAWQRALEMFPQLAGPGSPRALLAELHQRRGDRATAIAALRELVDIDGDTLEPHLALAKLAAEAGDTALTAEALERAVYIDPLDPDIHARLATLHEDAGRWEAAARSLETLVALEPRDPVVARHRLASARLHAGDLRGARSALLAALESAPLYEPGLDLLLEIHEQMTAGAGGDAH
jgi:tetratricopeptide (TPR) repeat protein